VNAFGFERRHRLGRFLNVTAHDQTRPKASQRATLLIFEQGLRISRILDGIPEMLFE